MKGPATHFHGWTDAVLDFYEGLAVDNSRAYWQSHKKVYDVPVRGMLCFVEGDWPLLGGSFTVEGLDLLWPKKAPKIISMPGPLGDDHLRVLHRHLAAEFPPA